MSQDTQKKIHRASLLMMASIILSRVIGFLREWVLAQTVGATAMTDVYYASFTIPDFLNHLMAAGALSISFIPILAYYLEKNNGEMGKKIFRAITTIIGTVLILLILISEYFAQELAYVIAPGFDPSQIQLLTTLIRIILPAQIFFYWGGLAIAVQYTHGKFLIPAIAPILYNIGIISFGIALNKTMGIMGFSIGVLVGSFVSHFLIQFIAIRKLGYSLVPLFTLSTEIRTALRKYLWLTIPIMFGFSLVIADEWLAQYFGSFLEDGAISWLHYARREMRIPVDVIGQAAGIASFPYLARLWSRGAVQEYGNTLLREIKKIWALAPLASIFLMDHALPITHFIFAGGKFSAVDYTNTARALQMYSFAILFWTMQLIFSRGFYACQRTWLPSIVGTLISILAVPLYWYLSNRLSYLGLALAGSIGMGIYGIALWGFLQQHLKKNCPGLSFSNFYRFCGLWIGVLIVAKFASGQIYALGIYQGTRLSALADVIIAFVVIVAIGWIPLRTFFKRYTGTPLF